MSPKRPLIAGNWKMNGRADDARRWARRAVEAAGGAPNDVALFPPYPYLGLVAEIVRGSAVALGGQACHTEPFGAYTGDVAAGMLADQGCTYVLCGHSERRSKHDESDSQVAASMAQAVEEGLTPVLCVGETLDERRGGHARGVVLRQLEAGLEALRSDDDGLVVAYEPVWAIGTGMTATPAQAGEVHGWIRERVQDLHPRRAPGLRILYGGSVNPGTIGGLLAVEHVDGGLVGGASLDPDAFARLIEAVPDAAPADA